MLLSTVYLCPVAQPVGWCITDKEDQDVVKVFLGKIKRLSLDSTVSVIMTDDGMPN